MGMSGATDLELVPGLATRREEAQGFFERLVSKGLGWARKYSLFQYPFVTACCGMEYMSVAASRYDIARFGAEFPRFSPRQADLLMVVGTINCKQAPILKRIYEQMSEPKWVVAFGVCASSGGFYDNYATVQGIDRVVPVDVYIPGCPPRPEQVLDGLMLLQKKIQNQPHKLFDRRPLPVLSQG
jgi:NADH-quinone oxidoreductase subunit B